MEGHIASEVKATSEKKGGSMSEEETKVEAAAEGEEVQFGATSAAEDAGKVVIPKKKKRKWPIVIGVIAVVLVAAGAGFWVWHEQPSFCNAICHTPMDPYNKTYEYNSGAAGEDKWGNEVKDAGTMMVVTHKEQDVDCLGCHVPTLQEQVAEGLNWVSGNYVYPLEERSLKRLVEARGAASDEFCLNDSCHHVTDSGTPIKTRADLLAATKDLSSTRNPHEPHHGEKECSDCHKAHRASVSLCSQCHAEAPIPDGWLKWADANKLGKS